MNARAQTIQGMPVPERPEDGASEDGASIEPSMAMLLEHMLKINASDLYNRTPFVFNEETFSALCSDLNRLPLSEAVAASAAVPVVFSPIVLEAYGERCSYHPPGWLETARNNPSAPAALKAFGTALETYRKTSPELIVFGRLIRDALPSS